MAKKQKYYVVWKGHNPGIYNTWKDCQEQTKAYPGALYKSFLTLEEAKIAFHDDNFNYIGTNKKSVQREKRWPDDLIKDSICVDAACSGNPGVMEYRAVETFSGLEIFRQGPFKGGTNNIGEFLAIVHALAFLYKKRNLKTSIYSDSRTAMKWVERKKANTKLKPTRSNKILFELIARAEIWLRTHTQSNTIIKWDTKNWGEIPADFGRK